jgi:hypothetical protein
MAYTRGPGPTKNLGKFLPQNTDARIDHIQGGDKLVIDFASIGGEFGCAICARIDDRRRGRVLIPGFHRGLNAPAIPGQYSYAKCCANAPAIPGQGSYAKCCANAPAIPGQGSYAKCCANAPAIPGQGKYDNVSESKKKFAPKKPVYIPPPADTIDTGEKDEENDDGEDTGGSGGVGPDGGKTLEDTLPEDGGGPGEGGDSVRPPGRGGNVVNGDVQSAPQPGSKRVGGKRIRRPGVHAPPGGGGSEGGGGGVADGSNEGVAPVATENYHAENDEAISGGTRSDKFGRNLRAIKILKQVESENRRPTPEEQAELARYTGWGHTPQAFLNRIELQEYGVLPKGATEFNQEAVNQLDSARWPKPSDAKWTKARQALLRLLTPEEYAAARHSTQNAHYTSPEIIRGMWDALQQMGFKGGSILEPGMGTGLFYTVMPPNLAAHSRLSGVEMDILSGRIAKLVQRRNPVLYSIFFTWHYRPLSRLYRQTET